jgi:hypothetical protein
LAVGDVGTGNSEARHHRQAREWIVHGLPFHSDGLRSRLISDLRDDSGQGPSHPGHTVGPTFDIARPSIFVLPHQDAAWKIIKERLDALQQAFASLGQQAGLGALAPLVGQLHSMSQDIATHIPRTTTRPQRPGKPAERDSWSVVAANTPPHGDTRTQS